jgi:hypothetical protein
VTEQRITLGAWARETLFREYGHVSVCHLAAVEAVLIALISDEGDGAFATLNGMRTRRQLEQAKRERQAAKEGE